MRQRRNKRPAPTVPDCRLCSSSAQKAVRFRGELFGPFCVFHAAQYAEELRLVDDPETAT